MARIAIGGWQHETNTFAPIKADFDAFVRGGEWPPLSRGPELFKAVEGVHLPVTGAIDTLRPLGHELLPLLWTAATPSAHVTEDAFERISTMLIEDLSAALPVDGVFLDLHGAMVCEHLQDGEGELLRRVRSVVGPGVPVAASLDLHANLTPAMVGYADVLDIYRTYPHIDMGETGARTARHLHHMVTTGERWHAALRRPQFLIPLNWGCTLIEPARAIYSMIPPLIGDTVTAVAMACGFPLADIADVGPAVLSYARTRGAAEQACSHLLAALEYREGDFAGRVYSPDAAVAEAKRLAEHGNGTVILADSQDNPGGGGPGDTTGVLQALVDGDAQGAVVAVIADPEAATKAHAAGVGAEIELPLGEKSGFGNRTPYVARFKVLRLGDGSFVATGPMYRGARMHLGKMALLETAGVRVMVASVPVQVADQSILRHLGIEPAAERIIALKSSVHFRNDFQAMAAAILLVAAPGPVYLDPEQLPFQNMRPGIRRTPRRGNAVPEAPDRNSPAARRR